MGNGTKNVIRKKTERGQMSSLGFFADRENPRKIFVIRRKNSYSREKINSFLYKGTHPCGPGNEKKKCFLSADRKMPQKS